MSNKLSQLSNVLPTGTFLVFQILAPLATNNGKCGHTEVVLTSVTLSLLCLLCIVSSFSDTCKAKDGVVHYGVVTPWGLWNHNFRRVDFPPPEVATHTDIEAATKTDTEAATHHTKDDTPCCCPLCFLRKLPNPAGKNSRCFYKGPKDEYLLELDDFVCAALSVVALATISLSTTPVTTCFYPNLSESILKTLPVLVGLVVTAVCAFGVTPRNGIGFTDPTTQEKK